MLKSFFIDSLEKSEVGHFAIDTIRNVFWFCLTGSAALALQLFIKWAEDAGAQPLTIHVLTAVEHAVLIAALLWFLARLLVTTGKAMVRAWREIHSFLQQAEAE